MCAIYLYFGQICLFIYKIAHTKIVPTETSEIIIYQNQKYTLPTPRCLSCDRHDQLSTGGAVQRFLPRARPRFFSARGTAGISSPVITPGVACERHRQAVASRIRALQDEGRVPGGKVRFSRLKAVGTDCVRGDADDFVRIDLEEKQK